MFCLAKISLSLGTDPVALLSDYCQFDAYVATFAPLCDFNCTFASYTCYCMFFYDCLHNAFLAMRPLRKKQHS